MPEPKTLADLVEKAEPVETTAVETASKPLKKVDQVAELKKLGKLTIHTIEEVQPWVNILIYGEPGTGKTVLSGSAADVIEMGPVVLVDAEGGTMSLRDFDYGCDVVRLTRWGDAGELYQALKAGGHGYKTVILDSLTELQKFCMQEIMKDVVTKDADRSIDVPSVREWGIAGNQIRTLVRLFRDLEMNVIFTALVNSDKDQKSGKVSYWPSLPGKLAREVPGYVDFVLYLYKKQMDGDEGIKRLLLTTGTDQYIGKDRSNKLPSIMVEPTMRDIYDYVTGTKSKNQEQETK